MTTQPYCSTRLRIRAAGYGLPCDPPAVAIRSRPATSTTDRAEMSAPIGQPQRPGVGLCDTAKPLTAERGQHHRTKLPVLCSIEHVGRFPARLIRPADTPPRAPRWC